MVVSSMKKSELLATTWQSRNVNLLYRTQVSFSAQYQSKIQRATDLFDWIIN